MSVLGIVPAAGKGSRWGGYYKELLPTGDDEWLLDRTIRSMKKAGAGKICVVTSIEKMTTHATHIRQKYDGVFYVIQRGNNDIWSAIKESLPFTEDYNLFAMPDTYFPLNVFSQTAFDALENEYPPFIDFYLGIHETQHPERFGVLIDGHIENKSKTLPRNVTYAAWGTLLWTKKVAEFWMEKPPESYTDAISSAMDQYRWETFKMEYYYDMAQWQDYGSFVRRIGK